MANMILNISITGNTTEKYKSTADAKRFFSIEMPPELFSSSEFQATIGAYTIKALGDVLTETLELRKAEEAKKATEKEDD